MANEDLKKAAIQAWETSLQCNFKPNKLNATYFQSSPQVNHEVAVAVFRYVFEHILEWSPEDALNYLTFQHIADLRLKKAFTSLIFPPEYKDPRCAVFYVAILCYPELGKIFDEQSLWIMEYNQAINSPSARIKYPDDVFEARTKAVFLLNHVLRTNLDSRFHNIEELYAFFGTKKVIPWLKSVKLSVNTAGSYFSSPLEYLHCALAPDVPREVGRNDFMLQFTEFKAQDGAIPPLTIRDIELARREEQIAEREREERKRLQTQKRMLKNEVKNNEVKE